MIVPKTNSIIYQEPVEEKNTYSKWTQNNIVNFWSPSKEIHYTFEYLLYKKYTGDCFLFWLYCKPGMEGHCKRL